MMTSSHISKLDRLSEPSRKHQLRGSCSPREPRTNPKHLHPLSLKPSVRSRCASRYPQPLYPLLCRRSLSRPSRDPSLSNLRSKCRRTRNDPSEKRKRESVKPRSSSGTERCSLHREAGSRSDTLPTKRFPTKRGSDPNPNRLELKPSELSKLFESQEVLSPKHS